LSKRYCPSASVWSVALSESGCWPPISGLISSLAPAIGWQPVLDSTRPVSTRPLPTDCLSGAAGTNPAPESTSESSWVGTHAPLDAIDCTACTPRFPEGYLAL